MAGNIQDFIQFLGAEEENQMKSCIHLRECFILIGKLDILYKTIIEETSIDKEEHKILVFLFLNVHREFYLSMANFIRLHLDKSYCNLRSAIDSALTAYFLINNPEKQESYLSKRKTKMESKKAGKEWHKIFKNIKATINNNLKDYPLAKGLIKAHDICSMFAHADAVGVLPRCSEDPENQILKAQYFNYEKTKEAYQERLIDVLSLFLEIFILFWNIIFKESSSKKIIEEIYSRVTAYQKKIAALKAKFSSAENKDS